MSSGIYILKNKINGKSYVGQSIDLNTRLKRHSRGYGNSPIARAVRKYSWENFDISVIEAELNVLDEVEIATIKSQNSVQPNGYNIEKGGRGILTDYKSRGRKAGETLKEGYASGRIKKPLWNKGRSFSLKHRNKISLSRKTGFKNGTIRPNCSMLGKFHSEETKEKLSKIAKVHFPNGPFNGRTHSEESKLKIKLGVTGFTHTEEMKSHLSEVKKGKNNPMYGSIGTMTGKTGKNHPAFGMKWYVNIETGEVKKFRPEDINTLSKAWKPGRKYEKTKYSN